MVVRQSPRWSEIKRFVGPSLQRGASDPLARVRTVADFQRLARRRTPRAVYDYVAGAAEAELSLARSKAAFDRVVFHPHVLRDVADVDATSRILGRPVAMPVVLGPTGFTRMMRTEGEPAVARAAGRAGIPYALSTLGTTSVDRLAAEAPDTDRWFQLYVWRDRARSLDLISRAAECGYSTLVLTVDVPVAGARLRDVHNGLTMPPTLTARTMLSMAMKPRWVFDALTTEPLAFESLGTAEELMGLINTVFDPAVTVADIEWLRSVWTGSIVVKGVQRVDDAKDVAAAGADGIAVSNHGGRQLDRAVSPLDLVADVVDAVGDDDRGVRRRRRAIRRRCGGRCGARGNRGLRRAALPLCAHGGGGARRGPPHVAPARRLPTHAAAARSHSHRRPEPRLGLTRSVTSDVRN